MTTKSDHLTSAERKANAVEHIAEIRDAHADAEAAGTFDPVIDYVAEDLIVAMPGHAPIEGRDAWAEKFNELMSDAPEREYEITYESAETLVSNDLAIDRGTCIDTAIGDDGEQTRTKFNYMMVFERTTDDSWEQIRTIWNKID